MHSIRALLIATIAAVTILTGPVSADFFHDYENFSEGFLGETFTHDGVTYRDANKVSGFFPDGNPFVSGDLGSDFIIEDATLFYDDIAGYGSPENSLTFGRAFVTGDNVTIGPLSSIWMDLSQAGTDVSLDLAYLENGPWGGIEYVLEAHNQGSVVGSDSFLIRDLGGRDNGTFQTMSISGVQFDQLHLFARLNGDFSAPRGMIDDLSITTVPEPTTVSFLLAGAMGLTFRRRRRA